MGVAWLGRARIAIDGWTKVSGEKCKCHNRFSSVIGESRGIQRDATSNKHSSFAYLHQQYLDVLSTGNDENKRVYDDDWLVLYLFNIHISIPFQSFVIQLESVRTRSKKWCSCIGMDTCTVDMLLMTVQCRPGCKPSNISQAPVHVYLPSFHFFSS